jgi:hypothetical protein
VSGEVITLVTLLITMTEVSERISQLIRSIVLTIFEVAMPILNVFGVAQIIVGLLLALGLRQEWLGWRLIISGLLTLVCIHFIVPLLLSFI